MNNQVRYGIPEEQVQFLLKSNNIKKYELPEPCTCGECGNIFLSLCSKYDINSLFTENKKEFSKAKEIFVSSLFGVIISQENKSIVYICIPEDDNGIDNYLRATDESKNQITMYYIQNTIFTNKSGKNLPEAVEKKCFKYGEIKNYYDKSGILLVNIESPIDLEDVRNLYEFLVKEKSKIVFKQIILVFTDLNNKIILDIFSLEEEIETTCIKFNPKSLKIEEKGKLIF